MVVPPRYAKAVTVKNTSGRPVKVTAWFGSSEQEAEGNAKIKEERDIPADGQVVLEEHTYDMGSWTAVAALDSIQVTAAGGELEATQDPVLYAPQVSSVINMLHVEVRAHPETVFQVSAVKEE